MTISAPVDFLIIAALEEERDALLRRLPGFEQLPPSADDVRVYFAAAIQAVQPGGIPCTYSVVVFCLSNMGRVQAAATVSDAIRRWNPGYVMLVGIAGGVKSAGVALGDILIAEQIADYEAQKITDEQNEIRWTAHPVDQRLLEFSRSLSAEAWRAEIMESRPYNNMGRPQRHQGTVATGDKVVAVTALLESFRNQSWPKLIGVEMEAGGAVVAAHQSPYRPGFFMVRCVSDQAGNKGKRRVQAWRPYACDAAAAYAIVLIRSGPVVPKNQTRTVASQPDDLEERGATVNAGEVTPPVPSGETRWEPSQDPAHHEAAAHLPKVDAAKGRTALAGDQEVILLIHGIRDEGEWGERIARALEALPGIEVIPLKFSFFGTIAFWLPLFLRWWPILAIQRRIRYAQRLHPNARLSVIAHSFGTYIIGSILKRDPNIRLHRLVLCGAVLSRGFRWDEHAHKVATNVINDCGLRDYWPVFAESMTLGYGAAGTFGFGWPGIKNRFHNFGHSGFFEDGFVETFWLPWYRNGELEPGVDAYARPIIWSLVIWLRVQWLAFALLLACIASRFTQGVPRIVLGWITLVLPVALVFILSAFLLSFTKWVRLKLVLPPLSAVGLAVALIWGGSYRLISGQVNFTWSLAQSERFRPTPDVKRNVVTAADKYRVKHNVETAADKYRRLARESGKDTDGEMAPEPPYLVFVSSQAMAVRDLPQTLSLTAKIKERAQFGYCVIDDGNDAARCSIDEVDNEFSRLRPVRFSTGRVRLVVLIFPFDQELYRQLLDDGLDGLIRTSNSGAFFQ